MYYSAAWYVYCREQFKSINECGTNPNESPRPCRGGARPWAVPLGSKLEVTSQLTQSVTVERICWRKHSKVLVDSLVPAASVHKTFPRITVNKLPRLPPASISYSSAISLFLRKNLGEKRLYSKIFQWQTACFQQLRHEPDVVNIIDSVTQG